MVEKSLLHVLIANKHYFVRSGIRKELFAHNDMVIVGEAVDGDETLRLTFELHPDILLLDTDMEGLKPVQILSRLKLGDLMTKVIIVANYDCQQVVIDMINGGVKGYVLLEDAHGSLVEAIRFVAREKTWMSPAVTEVIMSAWVQMKTNGETQLLSNRQITILQLIGQGYNSNQIGGRIEYFPSYGLLSC